MKLTAIQFREGFTENIWIIPLSISIFSFIFALAMFQLDQVSDKYFLAGIEPTTMNLESARNILSLIATTVITITSVIFSITILILSNASNQIGQRLLPTFMRQLTTQWVLGVFIGTFIYSVTILYNISFASADITKLYFSVTAATCLGIFSFFSLIYFIHFICYVVQIDNILSLIADEIIASISAQLVNCKKTDNAKLTKKIYTKKHVIRSQNWGYIQEIDYDRLLKLAINHDFMVEVKYAVGKFIFEDLPLFEISSNNIIDKNIEASCLATLKIGNQRSTVQDLEFAFEELAEVAIRALSPGVNNTYTAIHSVDRMIKGIEVLSRKKMQLESLHDDKKIQRVIRKVPDYDDIVRICFNRFRQAATRDLAVVIHTINAIANLFTLKIEGKLKKSLIQQVEIIMTEMKASDINEYDSRDINIAYNKFLQNI